MCGRGPGVDKDGTAERLERCFAALAEAGRLMEAPDLQAAYLVDLIRAGRLEIAEREVDGLLAILCDVISRATVTVRAFRHKLSSDRLVSQLGRENPGHGRRFLVGLHRWAERRIKAGQIGTLRHARPAPPPPGADLVATAFRLLREDHALYDTHGRLERLDGLLWRMYPDMPPGMAARVLAVIDEAMGTAYSLAERVWEGGLSREAAIGKLCAACPALNTAAARAVFAEALYNAGR